MFESKKDSAYGVSVKDLAAKNCKNLRTILDIRNGVIHGAIVVKKVLGFFWTDYKDLFEPIDRIDKLLEHHQQEILRLQNERKTVEKEMICFINAVGHTSDGKWISGTQGDLTKAVVFNRVMNKEGGKEEKKDEKKGRVVTIDMVQSPRPQHNNQNGKQKGNNNQNQNQNQNN